MIDNIESFKNRLSKNSKWNAGCLECTYKAKTQSGYCLMKYGRSTRGAHRISWMVHRGEIPKGLCVLHKCDNPICINPEHLFLGTPLDNSFDMRKKGRQNYQGARKHNIDIDIKCVEMRKNNCTLKEISRELNITTSTANSILRRNSEKEQNPKLIGVPKYPKEIREHAHHLRKVGFKCKDIQKILGIPKKTLTSILHNRTKNVDLIIN